MWSSMKRITSCQPCINNFHPRKTYDESKQLEVNCFSIYLINKLEASTDMPVYSVIILEEITSNIYKNVTYNLIFWEVLIQGNGFFFEINRYESI